MLIIEALAGFAILRIHTSIEKTTSIYEKGAA